MPQTKCVLCEKKLKNHQRRPVNKHLIKYLRRHFLFESSGSDYICGKCSRPAYRASDVRSESTDIPETHHRDASSSQLKSPPSVRLSIHSATKSHAYCFVCKKPGPRLILVPADLRTQVFLSHNILITGESRCCPSHLNSAVDSFDSNVLANLKTTDYSYVSRKTIIDLFDKVRQLASNVPSKRMSFERLDSYSDEDINTLIGLNKEQFVDLHKYTQPHLRNTPVRCSLTTLGIFLFKLKSGLSNNIVSTLFGISKSSVRRAINSVRQLLAVEFVPDNLGFPHVTREDVISKHTRALAQSLLVEDNGQVILVLDGTYIYINKSCNFHFQRRSYSLHKGRPLVKPMIIVSTTGYFVSVLGPYFADSKNNDASILNHIMNNNIEEIRSWVKPSDIFVVDRGFRDSIGLLKDLGIQAEIPAFLRRGQKQMQSEDANTSRLVTKVRWVVEAANARIKRWKYLDRVLPTTQVPNIGDFVRIVCAISNKYLAPINATKDREDDQVLARQMLDRASKVNELQHYVEENALDRRSVAKWAIVEDSDITDFPQLDDATLRSLTFGTYPLKLSSSYIQEYVGGECSVQIFRECEGLLRLKLQSRHVSSKCYMIWIQYDADHIQSWYCKCKAGARTVGTCSHVAAVLWYLGQLRYNQTKHGVKDWGQYLEDAAAVPEVIDSSDSDESMFEE